MVRVAAPISIVVPTHNRHDKLRALLRSIEKHWIEELDSVVVVDDSSTPTDIEAEFSSINLRHILVPRRIFISRAKNIGWRHTKSDYVYFIDDDNVIDETTIRPVYEVISSSERIAAVMPAVLYKSSPDLVWVYATPFRDSRLRHNLVGRNLPRNPSLENRLLRTDALPNASIIRRKALEELSGFDERLVINSSMDLSVRLKARNWRVLACTGAHIFHDVEPPGKFGWWATHGSTDPQRVRYEIRDWFLIMHSLHGKESLFTLHMILESSRFLLPNLLGYLVRSSSRRQLVESLVKGYVEGLCLTS